MQLRLLTRHCSAAKPHQLPEACGSPSAQAHQACTACLKVKVRRSTSSCISAGGRQIQQHTVVFRAHLK